MGTITLYNYTWCIPLAFISPCRLPFVSPFAPFSTYLEPSFCVRTRQPLLPDARKLTLFVPSVTHLFPFTQNPDPPGFPDLNIHQLGRHCELVQTIRHINNPLMDRYCFNDLLPSYGLW